MENKNLDINSSHLFINDLSFKKIVDEFIKTISTYKKTKYEEVLNIFYSILKNESNIFSRKDCTLQINKLQLEHLLKIQDYIEALVDNADMDKQNAKTILNYLNDFCKFLTKNKKAKIYYKVPIKQVTQPKNEKKHSITVKFQHFMLKKNYAKSTCKSYATAVEYFLKNTNYKEELVSNTEFWVTSFKKFEEKITRSVLTETITPGSGYAYLKAISLFSKFLVDEKITNYKYKVPKRLICNGNRSNDYVKEDEILVVLENIFESSKHVLRDISILMILLETGCRPIEVANLNIDDININEKLIVLTSIKSSQRTLKLSDTAIDIIKSYLLIRRNYFPIENTRALFLSTNGTGMPSSSISYLIRDFNMKSFKEIKFTAKTLRHRFITNALNAGNDLDQVRECGGHKHPISTHYYFYRDINKLKKLFMGKSYIWGDDNV
ncbi:tyrosine-type recombinase/integrase [Bacillus sp. CGMCC 1.16607]|uniref:tyrosine-type recombinase/integrase n=1 Tax=Bacillus sp. CGMCC 1.16607 TaxID=3351842 RepID=UPI0036361A5F